MSLIEVLIAIFVMGIGILSIVRLMGSNIQTIDRVNKRTIATSLAKEGLEMVSNRRDTNILLGYERNCASYRDTKQILDIAPDESLCKDFFLIPDEDIAYYTIDGGLLSDIGRIQMKKLAQDELSQSSLIITEKNINDIIITGFTHGESNDPTFSRYIEFKKLEHLENTPISNQDIHTVRSIVLYKHSSGTGQVVLESFIANNE